MNRPRAQAWVPTKSSDPSEILEKLRVGKPDEPTSNWKIAKLGEPKANYRSAIIIISEGGGVVSYGYEAVTLQL